MNAFFRLMLIMMLGYGVAVFAAPVFVLGIDTLIATLAADGPVVGWREVPAYLGFGMTLTGTYAALPFLVAVGSMRLLKRRDWPSHAIAGALTAYCALFLAFGNPMQGAQINLVSIMLAGAGAGLVYWAVRRRFGWHEA